VVFEALKKSGKNTIGRHDSPAQLKEEIYQKTTYPIFDVRKESEIKSEHIKIC